VVPTDSKPVIASELGRSSDYDSNYNPKRLFPVSRREKREEIGIDPEALPFFGFDCWNHYEVSWLNPKGKPMVAMAEIVYPCHTPNIVESKSLKLYFNSLNQTQFTSSQALQEVINRDLAKLLDGDVQVHVYPLDARSLLIQAQMEGVCIDDLDVACSVYTVCPDLLKTESTHTVQEQLFSNILKSNCLVTHQPDWGSVWIDYQGPKIDRAALLQYLVSFRNHDEFHEQCIERIFIDIMRYCQPKQLTVYGRYTRRGGLDINPYRSTQQVDYNNQNIRLIRQ
jgi:7-cyano-7-deazaguanine reductase